MSPEETTNLRKSGSHVPWMHVFEWQQVCCDVFSIDIEERRRGYEKLLLWKSRKQRIPTGIECTIELVHVDLLDVNALDSVFKTGVFGEQEMQVMMSSAIMRFFNLLIECDNVANRNKTFKEIAASLGLPDWMVELRHTTAHSTKLPALDLLRRAVKVSLDWLLVNYWQEGNKSPNLTIAQSIFTTRASKVVCELLDTWESLNVFMRNGFSTVDEIDSKHLKDFLTQHFSKDLNYSDIYNNDNNNTELRTNSDIYDIDLEIEEHRNLSFILPRVGGRLFQAIKDSCSKYEADNVEKIVKLLMESKIFIPSRDLLKAMKTPGRFWMRNEEEIMKWLVCIWGGLLVSLQETYSVFPSLINELVGHQVALGNKCSSRQRIISLWIKVLCCSLFKSRIVIKKMEEESGTWEEKRERFDKKNAEWSGALFAKPHNEAGNFCQKSIIKFAVLSANKLTPLFLPSLLKVVRPPISKSSKNRLLELVSIYFPSERSRMNLAPSDGIHTLKELCPQMSQSMDVDVSIAQWFKTPLGALPWTKGIVPSIDFPESVKWLQRTKNSEREEPIGKIARPKKKNPNKTRKSNKEFFERRSSLKLQRKVKKFQ